MKLQLALGRDNDARMQYRQLIMVLNSAGWTPFPETHNVYQQIEQAR